MTSLSAFWHCRQACNCTFLALHANLQLRFSGIASYACKCHFFRVFMPVITALVVAELISLKLSGSLFPYPAAGFHRVKMRLN